MDTDTVKTRAFDFPSAAEQRIMLALRGKACTAAEIQFQMEMESGPSSTHSLLKSLRRRGLVNRREARAPVTWVYHLTTPLGTELADFIIRHIDHD